MSSKSEVRRVWTENGRRCTSPEYRTWVDIRNRCNNVRGKDYARYGGRGIRVCERWDSFDAFVDDMGARPSPLHTIERRDSDGDYSPANCRWATRSEQARNRSYCSLRSWELADKLGVSKATANQYVWQVRSRAAGRTDFRFDVPSEQVAVVAAHLTEHNAWQPQPRKKSALSSS